MQMLVQRFIHAFDLDLDVVAHQADDINTLFLQLVDDSLLAQAVFFLFQLMEQKFKVLQAEPEFIALSSQKTEHGAKPRNVDFQEWKNNLLIQLNMFQKFLPQEFNGLLDDPGIPAKKHFSFILQIIDRVMKNFQFGQNIFGFALKQIVNIFGGDNFIYHAKFSINKIQVTCTGFIIREWR
jgi:hypothetical protein